MGLLADEGVFPFLELYLGFAVVVYVLHTYLDTRQYQALKQPQPPAELEGVFEPELYKKTQRYQLDKWWFGLIHGVYDVVESTALLALGGLPFLYSLSGQVLATVSKATGYSSLPSEIWQTVAFVLLLFVVNTLMGLPWSLYSTFVIEEKHGFNKQTLGLFVKDTIISLLLMCVLIPPLVAAITYILLVSGPLLPLYLWGFFFAVSIVMMTIYPVLIAPLFNKFDPLPEGPLRSKIEALAGSLAFPLTKLYKVDGSKRSGHSNAYMYGFFKNKRIVLYDTLIAQCSEEQVVAVLAHELGHWKLRHTPALFTVGQLTLLLQFGLFTFIRNSDQLFRSFGFVDSQPVFVSLVLFQFIISPLDEVIKYLSNVLSRTFEFQADGFAVKLGHAGQLRSALLRLEEKNMSAMHVDPLFSAYHYSHPPLVERLKAIDRGARKTL